MNYRNLVTEKFNELLELNPDYTFCQTLYSVISELSKGKTEFKKSDLFKLDDKLFYKAVCLAIKKEEEDGKINQG
jgi:hypothetical protein